VPELWTLSRKSLEKIAADHDRISHLVRNLQARFYEATAVQGAPVAMYPAQTSSAVTALDSDAPGKGTANVYRRNTSTGDLGSVGELQVTVYNIGGAVESGKYCLVSRDAWGDWWLVVVPCE